MNHRTSTGTRDKPLERGGPPPHLRGFTLMELVAVIAILAILVAMLLPTISKVKNYTRKVGARSEAKNIETALKQYYAEYQKWPPFIDDEYEAYAIADDLALILQGVNVTNNGIGCNPKQLQFMQFSRFDPVTNPVSPWGTKIEVRTNRYFYAKFDCENFDKTIPGTSVATIPPSGSVRAPIIVWTINADANPTDDDYIIGTWQQ